MGQHHLKPGCHCKAVQGRGHAALCLWHFGPLSRTGVLPLGHLPGAVQRPLANTGRLAASSSLAESRFPRIQRTLLPGRGEKRFGVVLSQGSFPSAWGPARRPTLPGKGRTTRTRLFLPRAPSESSAEPKSVSYLLGSPAAQPWVKEQARPRETVGLFLPRLRWGCWASKGLNMRPLSAISLHI